MNLSLNRRSVASWFSAPASAISVEQMARVGSPLAIASTIVDLPTPAVTPGLLRDLYAQHLEELEGPAPADDAEGVMVAPVAVAVPMNCR